MELQIENA